MDMSVAGPLSTALASSKLTGEFGVKMLAKTLDTQKTEADGLMKMMDAAAMERSVNPAVGGNIDLSV